MREAKDKAETALDQSALSSTDHEGNPIIGKRQIITKVPFDPSIDGNTSTKRKKGVPDKSCKKKTAIIDDGTDDEMVETECEIAGMYD